MTGIAAILLAGGRATRMGGVAKPLLEVGGITLLDAAISAARSVGADPIIGVGPASPRTDVTWVREEPAFGGPAAGIIVALPFVTAPRALILACDLPRAADAARLLCASPFAHDGVCLVDASGRRQWLTGVYRTDALRAAAARLPDGGRDAAVRALLADLAIDDVCAPGDPRSDVDSDEVTFDIDTWDDLIEARRIDARRREL